MLTFLIRNQDTIATDTNGGYHFDFLLPGLLGSRADFTRHFRKPIEKGRDRDKGRGRDDP